MKNRRALWIIAVWLGVCIFSGFNGLVVAQEKTPAPVPATAPAAVEGVKGVKQDAVERVKNVESGITTGTKNAAQGVNKVNGVETVNGVKQDAVQRVKNVESGITTGTKNAAQGVNKIDGVETINGVKADGRPAVAPLQPVTPVVQPVISGAGSIQAVNGVGGINAAKLRNLEAALQLKHGDAGPPTGKGRAAAAGLLGPPGGKLGPKAKDGREGFQEFEKLQNSGS